LKEHVVEQLAVTDGSEELTDHRALVESRLNQVLALANDPDASLDVRRPRMISFPRMMVSLARTSSKPFRRSSRLLLSWSTMPVRD